MTILLALLRRYWLHMAVVAIVALLVWRHDAAVYERGARDERAKWLTKENAALTQAIADNAKANDERRAAQKEVDRLATLPEQVRETNSAIKAAVR
jgi:Tfp pilus assembly protein PilN